MKKYYYEGPTFKLWRGSRVTLLNFEGGFLVPSPSVPRSRAPESQGLGPTFTSCRDTCDIYKYMVYGIKVSHVTLLLIQATICFQNVKFLHKWQMHLGFVLKKKKQRKSLPGLQSDNRLGWKNAVLDLSSVLFTKSELHCRRFAPLSNSWNLT